MKICRNMLQPNADANTGDNPAYRRVNLISSLFREWEEGSRASSSLVITMAKSHLGQTIVKFLMPDFHHNVQTFPYPFLKLYKNVSHFTCRPTHVYNHVPWFILKNRLVYVLNAVRTDAEGPVLEFSHSVISVSYKLRLKKQLSIKNDRLWPSSVYVPQVSIDFKSTLLLYLEDGEILHWVIQFFWELEGISEEENIVKWIKGQRISWLGQLERMEEDRMPKKTFT